MKTLLATILALGASLAQANTIYPLQIPTNIPAGNQPSGRFCVGHAFAGDLVTGTCQSLVAVGSRLPSYTATVYAAVWDLAGNVKGDTFCGTAVQPSRSYPAKWTYQPGYDAESCYLPTPATYEPVLIGYAWYGYITTSPDGAYELLTLGHNGVVNQF